MKTFWSESQNPRVFAILYTICSLPTAQHRLAQCNRFVLEETGAFRFSNSNHVFLQYAQSVVFTAGRSTKRIEVGFFDAKAAKDRIAPADGTPVRTRSAAVIGKHILGNRIDRPDRPDPKHVNPAGRRHSQDERRESPVSVSEAFNFRNRRHDVEIPLPVLGGFYPKKQPSPRSRLVAVVRQCACRLRSNHLPA